MGAHEDRLSTCRLSSRSVFAPGARRNGSAAVDVFAVLGDLVVLVGVDDVVAGAAVDRVFDAVDAWIVSLPGPP